MIKIAIISDMHCMHSSKEKSPENISTHLYSDDLGTSENRHPVKALYKLINKETLRTKLLICPGDITNHADKQGLLSGWSYLEKIRSQLNATDIVATVGNHDIQSRNDLVGNVFLELQSLSPDYPVPKDIENSNYWSLGYLILKRDETLILNINSCFFHKNSITAKKSQIESSQLEAIEKELNSVNLDDFPYKIVLIHHHPIIHSNMDYEDVDKLDKGDELISLIKKFKFQIIVHGHKHESRLTISNSIPIFCSGSFSSLMNVNILKCDNTFHILNLEKFQAKGFIETWIYAPQEGWIYRQDTPFPCVTGFGFDGIIGSLAKEINEWLSTSKEGKMSLYNDLKSQFPDLNYLNKDKQIELAEELKNNFNLSFHPNYPSKPEVIIATIR
jgi:predicted phosphodiesterase